MSPPAGSRRLGAIAVNPGPVAVRAIGRPLDGLAAIGGLRIYGPRHAARRTVPAVEKMPI